MTDNLDWQRERITELLVAEGIDPGDIPENLDEASNHVADFVFGRGDHLSACDIADTTGMPLDEVVDNLHHLGIVAPSPNEVLFNERDIALVEFLQSARTESFEEGEGIEILHVAGTSLATTAEAAVASHVQGPESRTTDFVQHLEINLAASMVGLEMGQHLGTAFRHHLRQAALRQRRTQSPDYRELVRMAVGFVDLVGFTSLSQTLDPGEIVDLVKRFESQAHELAHGLAARVVKLVGDEVMFVSEDPADAAAFALGMMHTYSDRHVVPRGGIAMGDLVNLHGDYFGPVVNLAARLVAAAVPGEVLIDDSLVAEDSVVSEPAGRRMLKGFDYPVRVHSLITASPIASEGLRTHTHGPTG